MLIIIEEFIMINENTVTKLIEMRLCTMAEAYKKQLQDTTFNELLFEERLGIFVDLEWARRKNNKLTRLIRKAKFCVPEVCIEDIQYHAERKLDKAQKLMIY